MAQQKKTYLSFRTHEDLTLETVQSGVEHAASVLFAHPDYQEKSAKYAVYETHHSLIRISQEIDYLERRRGIQYGRPTIVPANYADNMPESLTPDIHDLDDTLDIDAKLQEKYSLREHLETAHRNRMDYVVEVTSHEGDHDTAHAATEFIGNHVHHALSSEQPYVAQMMWHDAIHKNYDVIMHGEETSRNKKR